MNDSPKTPPNGTLSPTDPALPSQVGHVHAREAAIAQLGNDISAGTIETIRRMHVSGAPGIDGWIGIAKQVEAIARTPNKESLRSLRETVKEEK